MGFLLQVAREDENPPQVRR